MKKTYQVYKITNQVNGNFYIGYTGLTLEKRFRCHATTKNTKFPIARAFQKYGRDAFVIEELSTFKTKEEACDYEIQMITEMSPHYNAHPGGTGGAQYGIKNPMYGKIRSLEWRHQKSKEMRGKNNPMYGQTHTLASRQKIRESKIGKPSWNKGKTNIYNEETLTKLRQPKTEEHKKKLSKDYLFVNPDGEIIVVRGLIKFCKEQGLHPGAMSQVYNGKRDHHKGWSKSKI